MAPSFADPSAASLPLHVVSPEGLEGWRAALPAPQAAWLEATGFKAALGDLRPLPEPDGSIRAAVIGHGTPAARSRSRFALSRAAGDLPPGAWHLEGELTPRESNEAALGWLLAHYRFTRYRHGAAAFPDAPRALLKPPPEVDAHRLQVIARAEFLTRDLINTPASDMGPVELEAAFLALATRHGAWSEVTRGDDLLVRNLPMIHAVGRASARAPRLLDLRWGRMGPLLTLVGKGVCFDTGGLDIKPAAGMALMKKDMGGAATVMGLAQMIMALDLPLRLRLLVPAVENAISGNAFRPGDILTSRKGLTVEVNNTDAEGRLVLADALALADEEEPALIVSMATLTGAARVAVGPDLAPYFTGEGDLAQALEAAAEEVCDPVWRLPFHEPYEAMLDTPVADLDNAPSGGFAGAVTAALFLRRFVANPRYLHFDIYAHSPKDAPARPKGGVGMGARALFEALPRMLGL